RIKRAGDERLFFIGEALRRGVSIQTIHEWSQIDLFFLRKFEKIVQFEAILKEHPFDAEKLYEAKRMGFADVTIAQLWDANESEIYEFRKENGIIPVYKKVDTCAGEYDSET